MEYSLEEAKTLVAKKALEFLQDDMVIGLGTGSTATLFIRFLSEEVRKGLKIRTLASSLKSEQLARSLNIPLIPFSEQLSIDLYVDGADRFDKELNLIKGGGGALLREKILAFNSQHTLILADESKYSSPLFGFPLPLELLSFGAPLTIERLRERGFTGSLRPNYTTDNGNLIFDIQLQKPIVRPQQVHEELRAIPGVLEVGLFIGLATKLLMAQKDGTIKVFKENDHVI